MVLFLPFRGPDVYDIVLYMIEHAPWIIACNVILLTMVRKSLRPLTLCAVPLFIIVTLGTLTVTSYEDAMNKGYDITQPSLRAMLEKYIQTGEGDVDEIITSKKYPPLLGSHELMYFVKDLFLHSAQHSDAHNQELIPETYNLGNDWFKAFLGEPMTYTSAIFKTGDESLMEAQTYKYDFVADAIDLQPGDVVLDIGCGWGPIVEHFSNKYNATVIGVTISEEQVTYFEEVRRPRMDKKSKSKIKLLDANLMLQDPELSSMKFDKIVSLEMMEHAGIKRYQSFLKMIKTLLKDDGLFYLQVAGLRRQWEYTDFVWGLFMGEYIFPGADASTHSGWVVNQLERAGFELQRMNNLGSHYSKTIAKWLKLWMKNKEAIVKKYGIMEWRKYHVFLRWSVTCAEEGYSTVNMYINTKQLAVEKRVETQQRLVPKW